jgi:homoserine kinase
VTAAPFTVRAPASSANLGPLFDCGGIALDLCNELIVTPGSGVVSLTGEGADALPTDASNVVVAAFERAAPGAREQVDLACVNRIPLARGLGSSTAAVAAGLIAGWTVAGRAWDAELLTAELTRSDGHPDNAAACAHGGLVQAALSGTGIFVESLPVPAWLEMLLIIPTRELSTAAARAVLPTTIDDATSQAAATASTGLLDALRAGDRSMIADWLESDVLHEPFRASLVPELARARESLEATGALGATLSGAGPTVLAWCDAQSRPAAEASLRSAFPDCRIEAIAPSLLGAHVVEA